MGLPTINTKTFSLDSQLTADSVRYIGVAGTDSTKDSLTLRRTAPKATKTSPGVARTSSKRVITELVNGQPVDGIIETTTSIPVGFSAAGKTALRADMAGFLQSTAGPLLIEKAQINFG